MFLIFEVLGTLLGAGLVVSAAPTLAMARQQAEGAATTAIVRLVIGSLILMAAWKLFFSDQAVLTPSTTPVAIASATETPEASAQPPTPISPQPEPEPAPQALASANTADPTAGCTKDIDCKGDRICVSRECVAPAHALAQAGAEVAPAARQDAGERSFFGHFIYANPSARWYEQVGKALLEIIGAIVTVVMLVLLTDGPDGVVFFFTIVGAGLLTWGWFI